MLSAGARAATGLCRWPQQPGAHWITYSGGAMRLSRTGAARWNCSRKCHESRKRHDSYTGRPDPARTWLGTGEIAGRTLLIHADHALGDTIQFCRYASLAAQRGARVVLAVQCCSSCCRPSALRFGSCRGRSTRIRATGIAR